MQAHEQQRCNVNPALSRQPVTVGDDGQVTFHYSNGTEQIELLNDNDAWYYGPVGANVNNPVEWIRFPSRIEDVLNGKNTWFGLDTFRFETGHMYLGGWRVFKLHIRNPTFFGTHRGKVVANFNEKSLAHLIPDDVSYEHKQDNENGAPDMSDDVIQDARDVITLVGLDFARENKIRVIKMVRTLGTPVMHGLREAKDAVESYTGTRDRVFVRTITERTRDEETLREILDATQREITVAQEIQTIIRAELDQLNQPANGSVIMFTHRYRPGGTIYTYVAYRADNGDWYITGNDDSQTWHDLRIRFDAIRNGQFHRMG